MVGAVVRVYRRVLGVPKHDSKLGAAAPVVRYVIGLEAMLEVYGTLVDIVAVWE
jgi:hypothetical protein